MFVNIAIQHIKPGKEERFRELLEDSKVLLSKAPGFITQLVLKDNIKLGRHFYLSIWESEAQIEAYRVSAPVQQFKHDMVAADLTSVPGDQVDCDIVQEINFLR